MAKKTIKKVSKGMATRGTGRMGDKRREQYDANKRLQDTLASKNFIQNGGEVTSPAQYLNPNRKGTAKQNAFNSNFDRGKSTTNRSPVTMNNSPKKKKK